MSSCLIATFWIMPHLKCSIWYDVSLVMPNTIWYIWRLSSIERLHLKQFAANTDPQNGTHAGAYFKYFYKITRSCKYFLSTFLWCTICFSNECVKIYCHLQNSCIFYDAPPGNPASLYQNLVMNWYCIVKSNLLHRSKQVKRSDVT